MFKQDNYEQIFSHRITNQNIQLIKKFFIFQPTNQPSLKPYSSLMNKVKQPTPILSRKTNPKFTGGFQQSQKSNHDNQEEVLESSSIVLRSKKAPTAQISSFLLGLTCRIEKESQQKLAELQAKKICTISPEKKISYEQVMTNLNKLRKQNRSKYASILPTSNTNYSQTLSNQNQLPLLEKRLSTDKRTVSSVTNTFIPPIMQNKSSTPTCSSEPQKQKEKRMQRMNNQSNRAVSITYSSKIIKSLQQPTFIKGYLAYDPDVKDFLQKNQQNILGEPTYKKPFFGLSAANYLVLHRFNLKVIAEKNSDEQIQIASLTKIMTCYLSILICKKYKIDLKETIVRVTQKAQVMPGTSAELQAGDIVKIIDLLYGLMLPSGNDASVAIAEVMGKIIQKNKKKPSKKTYYQTFIYHMNFFAKQIGIQQTYQNTSGLSMNPNYSSPKAVSLLASIAMKNPTFYEIINCKQYQLQIRNQRYGLSRKLEWKNTNKLLWKGWEGVKTGTTQTAGHCLISCKGDYIISVFDCQTLNKRFQQSVRIYEIMLNLPLVGQKKQAVSNSISQIN